MHSVNSLTILSHIFFISIPPKAVATFTLYTMNTQTGLHTIHLRCLPSGTNPLVLSQPINHTDKESTSNSTLLWYTAESDKPYSNLHSFYSQDNTNQSSPPTFILLPHSKSRSLYAWLSATRKTKPRSSCWQRLKCKCYIIYCWHRNAQLTFHTFFVLRPFWRRKSWI